MTTSATIHPDADVEPGASLGPGTRVWAHATVRRHARVGADVVVGRGAVIDVGVVVGDRCKIQDRALLYAPAHLEEGVFIGPGAILSNDVHPRAISPDGTPKSAADWEPMGVHIAHGAAVGAGAVLVAGVRVGRWATVAAGAVVTRDVPDHALMAGVPARRIGWVGPAGRQLVEQPDGRWRCPVDGTTYEDGDEGLRPSA